MNQIAARFRKHVPAAMLLVSIAWCGTVAAQSPSDCHAIVDPTGRLLCYDRVTGRPDPSTVDAAQPAAAPTPATELPWVAEGSPPAQAAGPETAREFPPAPAAPTTAPEPMQPQSTRGLKAPIEVAEDVAPSPIEKLEKSSIGRYRFHLQNGEVWEQLEPGRITVREGDSVRVQRSTFGAWLLREVSDGSRTVRVRRVQ